MAFNFDACPERRTSDSIKWRLYPEDVLPMWVADMDFCSPPQVIAALHERIEHGIFGYPEFAVGAPEFGRELRGLLVDWLQARYGWTVAPEHLVFIPGVVTGFHQACYAFASPGGGVLVQTPVYPPIWEAAKTTRSIPQEMELTRQADGSYEIDWQAFEVAITPQTRLFLLCNPHNPVGRVFREDELLRMAEICERHGVLICSDEIHCDLVFSGQRHIPLASLSPEIARRTITLMAPSKTFNLAGLQCAFAIIPDEGLRKQYLAGGHGLVEWVNLLGYTAAAAAYRHGEPWLAALLAYLEGNRDWLARAVAEKLPGVRMGVPQGTYLAWLDCRALDLPDHPDKFFLEKGRVALNDGRTFGPGGKGFVRLNFGCPRSQLEEAVERMSAALALL